MKKTLLLSLLTFCTALVSSVSAVSAQSPIASPETTVPTSTSPLSPALPTTGVVPGAAIVPTTPINLTISPVTLFLETEPGVPVQAALKVRNNSDKAEQLKITFGSFVADASGQKPQLLEPKPDDEFMRWLSVDQPELSVGPGEWKTVNLTFHPPATAALAYYYTVQISRASSLLRPGETVIQGTPAVLVLSTVQSPNARKQLDLAEFSVTAPFVEFLPQTFSITIKNTGNVHLAPVGNIFIDGQGQKDLAVLSLNPSSSVVLPQSSRTLSVDWIDGFPLPQRIEIPETEQGLNFAGYSWNFSAADKLRFGKYTAHLLMVYDNGERDVPIESFVSFWVIPWKLLLCGLVIVLFTLLGIRSMVLSVIVSLTKRLGKSVPPQPPVSA